MRLFIKSLVALSLLASPAAASAAVLYFDPMENRYGPGDDFALTVKLDVTANCVNTIEAEIEFPREQMLLKDFLIGESIISLWLANPSLDGMAQANASGRLYFAGGIPGGYCGKIPGDPGDSNILGRLIFQLPKFVVGAGQEKELKVDFAGQTRVLANDGLGTEDTLITRPAAISLQDKAVDPELDWDYIIKRDKIPPEPFLIELHRNRDIYNGKYYLIFNAVDKQSGLDHYEAIEIAPESRPGPLGRLRGFIRPPETAPASWARADMPYIIADQSLRSVIRIKALDRAGNERIVEYIPEYRSEAPAPPDRAPFLAAAAAAALLLATALAYAFRRNSKKRQERDLELTDNKHDKEDP